uniref:zinc ribbon domain-containing protein n=1 Tax=Eubacterium cellulosolvens TaxID=29322 RepID=UPI000484E925|nr:zinc ribbon domain-containing protein [[Eubacterium] cellulosolvens]
MALMICPDCGNQVSDKAERCPVCGCPKSAIIAFKEEEKARLDESIRKQKKDRRNRILKIIVPIALCLLIIGIVIFARSGPDTSGLYRKLAWGTSIEDFKQKVPDGYESEKENSDGETSYLNNEDEFLGLEGVSVLVDYSFKDNKLVSVLCTAMPEDDSGLSDTDTVKLIRNQLNELYGNYKKDGTSAYIWRTEQSEISLWAYKSIIFVTFKDQANTD